MKIITRVGEWLPTWLTAEVRPVLTFTGAGSSLVAGSLALAARAWTWLGERLTTGERLGTLAAGGYLTAYGCVHAPQVAKFAAPTVLLGWCVAAWCTTPPTADEPDDGQDPPAEPDPQDVIDLVRDLIGDDTGVLLTALRDPLRAADTRAVRQLLATAGIPVRPGVRTRDGNGPGVHRRDLPVPLPSPTDPTVDVVAAGESANTNTNNALRVESREGMTIISDPADRYRAHSLKKAT